jgi:hypothetical protein
MQEKFLLANGFLGDYIDLSISHNQIGDKGK